MLNVQQFIHILSSEKSTRAGEDGWVDEWVDECVTAQQIHQNIDGDVCFASCGLLHTA